MPKLVILAAFCLLLLGAAPYRTAPKLFDQTRLDLGLKPLEGAVHATIFAPGASDHFNNGLVLVPFGGALHAQWQSSARDEDSPDTRILHAVSTDGVNWSAPVELRASGTGGAMHSNGGWWTDGETLVAFTNVWPTGFQSGDGGYTEFQTSRDGRSWSAPKRVMGKDGKPVEGVIEQDPRAMPSGRIVGAFHLRPGLTAAPHYTDDPLATSGWVRGQMANLPHEGRVTRELEPSLFRADNGCIVMLFRDQASSFRQLASESCDEGARWTTPSLTTMPDSRSKQSAGNLPDGTIYIVNAPNAARPRIPLAITLSPDGRCFDRAFLLRGQADLPPIRTEGRYKRPGYHYPKSVLWGDRLAIGYTVNKEDVAVTLLPVSALKNSRKTGVTCE